MLQILEKIAKGFDGNIRSVTYLARCRNRIYKADCGSYSIVLRLTSSSYRTKEEIIEELSFQNYLYENGAPVSQPIQYENGQWCTEVRIDEEQYCVSAFRFVEGKNWDERDDIKKEVLYNIGKALGKVHALSETYEEKRKIRRMWYEQQELLNVPALFEKYNPALLDEFEKFMDQMKLLQSESESFGLTHGDFLMSNYLVNGNQVTIIDFDECEYSWYAMDLAICLRCYLLGMDPENLSMKSGLAEKIYYNLIQGYCSERKVTPDMVYALNQYIAVRDYIELSQLLQAIDEGIELNDIENTLLDGALDRVMNQKAFIDFDLARIEKFL